MNNNNENARMKRRDFLKLAGAFGLAGAAPALFGAANAATPEPFGGRILLTLHTGGGWDHSSFADPRENPAINHWAGTQVAGEAGNLRYAPMAENAEFFNKYYRYMLVINGIDLQTNGHDAATRHRNTGQLLAGYPSLNELYAATSGSSLPLSFVRQGGFSGNQGLMPFTALPDESLIRTLSDPNYAGDGRSVYASSHMQLLRRFQDERLQQQRNRPTNTPRWQQKLDELQLARSGVTALSGLGEVLPETLDQTDLKGDERRFLRELHLFLVLAKAGMTATGSFATGGWDSHGDHDNRHANNLIHLTRSLDYLWSKAETMGLAERLIVHVTSDVGRTPHYNANNGKDHWSVGSDIVMMKNAPWANRIVGASGAGHERIKINPATLAVDEAGVYLRPRHIHRALRQLLAIDQHDYAQRYDLNAEALPIFNPSFSTGIQV